MEAPGRLADWWCSLYTLFLSNKGLKLRISIPDTFIIRNGSLSAWFQTCDDGYVVRLSPGKLTPENVYKAIVRKEVIDQNINPHRYVAIAHFARHASRLLRKEELDVLLGEVDPPGTPPRALQGDISSSKDLPYCIQLYVPPAGDTRYVTTYSMEDGASCTSFARRFSSRYTHAHDNGESEMAPGTQPSSYGMRPNSANPPPLSIPEPMIYSPSSKRAQSAGPGPPSHFGYPGSPAIREDPAAEELHAAAAHQLEAEYQGPGDDGQTDISPPTPGAASGAKLEVDPSMRAEIRRLVQAIVSFIERAHGLRLIGMVGELIRSWDGRIMLLAVHATQWDARHTKGSMSTYTERMNEFRKGKVAPPAAQPRNRAPTYTSQYRGVPAHAGQVPHSPIFETSSRQGVHDRPWTANVSAYHPPREWEQDIPESPTRPSSSRPGWYGIRNSTPLRPSSTRASGGIRPGAGGSPTTREIVPSPKTRQWSARTADAAGNLQGESFNRDVIAGLADDLEATKECLQLQYDTCARTEMALQQLHEEYGAAASSAQQSQAALEEGLLDTQRERNALRQQVEELTLSNDDLIERSNMLQKENESLTEHLHKERDAAAAAARHHASQEADVRNEVDKMRTELKTLREERVDLNRRITQEQEVVQAVRTQLVEYKLYIQQLEERAAGMSNAPTPPPRGSGTKVGSTGPDPPDTSRHGRTSGATKKAVTRRSSKAHLDTGAGAPGTPAARAPGRAASLMKKSSPVKVSSFRAPSPPMVKVTTGPGGKKTTGNAVLDVMASQASGVGSERGYKMPVPEPSMASSIAEEPSQEYNISANDFVPDFVNKAISQTELGIPQGIFSEEDMTSWEDIHIGDLVQAEGQPAYMLHERFLAVVGVLQTSEIDLRDIYTYYCSLGRLIKRGNRCTMGMGQFMKFARDTGCISSRDGTAETVRPVTQAQIEVVFTQVVNGEIHSKLQGDHRYFFEGFLESVIRLACLKYLAPPSIFDVPPGLQMREASKSGSRPSTAEKRKAAAQLDAEHLQQTDLVTTVKVYLYNDVLPRARRHKLSGSSHARRKASSRDGSVSP